jgi:DGQHR domain-containing protein
MINISYIPLKQNGFQLFITKLTIDELLNNSEVSIFNPETGEGYQRPPIPSHYKKIARYLESEESILLPLGVLTAVYPDDFNESEKLELNGKLRIVDGQHRVAGFRHLSEINPSKYETLKDFEVPVTIMVLSKDDIIDEMDTFININSKAKRINTDLAKRLSYERRKEDGYLRNYREIIEDISIEVTLGISRDIKSLWYKAVRMSTTQKDVIISLNAFTKSLTPLIELFVKYFNTKDFEGLSRFGDIEKMENNSEVISFIVSHKDLYVENLKKYINDAWYLIKEQFEKAFNEKRPYFKKEYNIQKGIGLYAFHIILTECIRKEQDLEKALQLFKTIVNNTTVKLDDWKSGGSFSGNNSLTGFKVVAEKIMGDEWIKSLT